MESLQYMLLWAWQWAANNGLAIVCLTILLILVPHIRRFVLTIADGNIPSEGEQSKGRRALIGAVVYTVEVIAYFVLIIAMLSKFGIPLITAATPATIVSAVVGSSAQGAIVDFPDGMFIIIEKQYGTGGWIKSHPPSDTVQGDVANMTLRATTIRIPNGEEIIVSNSEARICISYPSQWSRAVAEVPIPMIAGGSTKDSEERTATIAKHVIVLDSVKDAALFEIKLQSSTEFNPPTIMGLLWTVTMRLTIDYKPGDQWPIERVIRVVVIDTWWDDYGERAQQIPFAPAEEIAGYIRDDTIIEQLRQADAKQGRKQQLDDGDSVSTGVVEAVANTTAQPDTAEIKLLETQTVDKQDGNERPDLPHTGADPDDVRREQEDSRSNNTIRKLVSHPDWKTLTTRQEVRRILFADGYARVLTTMLLVTLMVPGVLNLMTVETEDGPSGWLAPGRWSDCAVTQEEVSEGSSAPQSSSQPTSTTQSVRPTGTLQQTQTSQNQPPETSQQARSTQNRTPSIATSTELDFNQSNIDNESTGGSQSTDSTNNAEPDSAGA